MYSQHDALQLHTLIEAKKLASDGQEFAHLIKLLAPEFALRLKIHVQNLLKTSQTKPSTDALTRQNSQIPRNAKNKHYEIQDYQKTKET